MSAFNRQALEELIVRRIADGFVDALKENLETSRDSDGNEFAPMQAWGKIFRDESGQRVEGDRTNADRPLLDTGRLRDSIQLGYITSPIAYRTSTGAHGSEYKVTILAADYGLPFTRETTFRDVYLAKHRESRRSRNFADLEPVLEVVRRSSITVPARKWNAVTQETLNRIAYRAVRGIAGA